MTRPLDDTDSNRSAQARRRSSTDRSAGTGRLLAAIDLGSNSFRLVVAEAMASSAGHQLRIMDQIKETVRLGAGLDRHREISPEAQQRALDALALFGERLDGFQSGSVRAVATNTFRVAQNSEQFLSAAREALGFPIDVVAGREEARLIYVGASHALPLDQRNRLVIDIGGGSTECIVGRDYDSLRRESFQVGCVALTREFFADGKVTRGAMRRARLRCGELVAAQVRAFRRIGWDYAIGTSGSAKALCAVAGEELGTRELTPEILAQIEERLVSAGTPDQFNLRGLKVDRQQVFAGGLAVMQAFFEEFGIESMRFCDSALREGILYDLLGRRSGTDRREITISVLVERYRLDPLHGGQVAQVALELYQQLAGASATPEQQQMLTWAARIREIGCSIAHDDAHKHGGYIIGHADLPGFSPPEQRLLAFLVLGQSGGLRKLRVHEPRLHEWQMLLCLRLAVILQRRRDGRSTPIVLHAARDEAARGWILELPQQWVDQHPLTHQSMEAEESEWQTAEVFRQAEYRVMPAPEAVLSGAGSAS